MTDTVRRSTEIAAPPEVVWALVTDLPRMGEWSPENRGGTWRTPGPAEGAVFSGTNGRGLRRWSTKATVTTYAPTRRFAFDVDALGLPASRWSYEVERTEAGCRVTETWTDLRGRLLRGIGRLATGVGDRTAFTAESIEQTLAGLKAAAERDAAA